MTEFLSPAANVIRSREPGIFWVSFAVIPTMDVLLGFWVGYIKLSISLAIYLGFVYQRNVPLRHPSWVAK